MTSIPTIDLCKKELKPNTSQWETTKEQVFKALEEYGCFEAIYDKVSNEIREVMFDTLEQVLPLTNKLKEYHEKPLPRYEGQIPRYPLRDNIYNSANLLLPESVETFANTFWDDGNPNYRKVIESFAKSLLELDEMVKRMVLESLELNDYIDKFLGFSNIFTLRFTQYLKAAQDEEKSNFGLPGHTDFSFLTIVKPNQAGLQVLTKNGEWIEPNISPNSYIVLGSDFFMAWTNGRVHSVNHRVTMEGDTDRFSIQLFASLKPGHMLEAPKNLVDEEHPLLFSSEVIDEYYKNVMSGAKRGFNLKAYAGV